MKISQRLIAFYNSRLLLWFIIAFGIVLRLIQYLANRSLWVDEAALASSIVTRTCRGLLQPLDYYQCAPTGFLMVERFFVELFGNSEYSLRLFPLLAGIASLFLFLQLAKKIISPKAVPVAVLLFAISRHLVYYSSEVKQYSTDVAVTLLLFLAVLYILSNELTFFCVVWFGLLGAAAIWFSHPAIFILAGIGICLAFINLSKKQWKKAFSLSVVFLFWASSFLFCYIYILRNYISSEGLLDFWKNYFMPFPPQSLADLSWLPNILRTSLIDPGGFRKCIIIIGVCFCVGYFSMFKKNKLHFFILLSPVFFALLASGFRVYPFGRRLVLYLVPVLLLGIAYGAEEIRKKLWSSSKSIGIGIVVLVILYPVVSVGGFLFKPLDREEIKPVLSYLNNHRQDGDVIYVYRGAFKAFRYYKERFGLDETNYIEGVRVKDNISGFTADLDKLSGNERVWIIFTHVYITPELNTKHFSLFYLDQMGTRIDSFKNDTASIYLYDLK